MSLHHIKKISVTEQILFQLEREILWGTWKPGYQIPSEVALARLLQVSRASVTSALDILRDQGILVTQPGKGTFVCEDPDAISFHMAGILDPGEAAPLDTIVEFLQLILVPATQLAVEKASPESLEDLSRLCFEMDGCKDSPVTFSQLDYRFYKEILICTGNEPLLRIFANADNIMMHTLNRLSQLADMDLRIRQHTQLVDCFKKKDPFRARILMNQEFHYFSMLLSEIPHD